MVNPTVKINSVANAVSSSEQYSEMRDPQVPLNNSTTPSKSENNSITGLLEVA